MIDSNLFVIAVIAFLASLVKGTTGFGPSIVVVSLGALFLPPQMVVVLSALLTVPAGMIMLWLDPIRGSGKFWIPLGVALSAGSVTGGLMLSLILPQYFQLILAIVILALGVWFFVGRTSRYGTALADTLPAVCSLGDVGVALFAGFVGGVIGIAGPPMVWYLGKRFAKRSLRQVLVPVFLVGSITRLATYAATGVVDRRVLLYGLASLPGLVLGIYLGNRVFLKVSENTFSRFVGAVLVAVAIRLVF